MQVLDAAALSPLLTYPVLAEALRDVLRLKRAGVSAAPVRTHLALPEGVLLLMPASDGQIAVTKLITVHPGNPARGLPTSQADILVLDAATGRRLLWLDGALVTARRTAAVSALAARLLAPDPAGPLLIVGAGVQARAHLEAFQALLGVGEVVIASRTPQHAEALAEYGRSLGMAASAVADPAAALERATLVVTATRSASPVLPDAVRPDAFVAAVGAFLPSMAELPPSLVRRSRLFVDTLDGARAEAGDFIQAGVDWATVTPLEQILDGHRGGSGPVVFKSVGEALWDLAAARAVLARLSL